MKRTTAFSHTIDNIIPYSRSWGIGFMVTASIMFLYGEALSALVRQWWTNDMYSYGFLIPFISLYMVWIRREDILNIRPSPGYVPGAAMLFISLSMLLAGHAGGIIVLEELSLPITIAGVVVLLFGIHSLRFLWLPIAYLLFMIPVWGVLTDFLHPPFQNFAAATGTRLLDMIGIPVYRDGIFVELPNITLKVARECSGVNYLLAVVALGIPMAYLFLRSRTRRIILLCSSVIIAIAANGLRVALIGAFSYYGIGDNIHGPFHMLQGLFVSVIGYAALFAGVWILSGGPSESSHTSVEDGSKSFVRPHVPTRKSLIFLSVFIVILSILLGSYIYFYKPSPVPLKQDLRWFPYEIGNWTGTDSEPDYEVFKTLGADRILTRTYRTDAGRRIKLYIGYYERQEQGKELVDYRTDWLYDGASPVRITAGTSKVIEVNRLIKPEGEINRLILFWYDLNGRVVTGKYRAKAYTTWDSLTRGRTNGAIIIVSSDIYNKAGTEEAQRYTEKFIKDILPVLPAYIP
ncbi:MAG TPA: EpsI family protein [Nitrospirae bacterium]|nr:EpsI family protein [Nitrospirota bacterium]